MSETKVFNVPDGNNSIDPALMMALSQNGGFGNGGNWMWMMFMWILFPWIFGGNGNFGGFGGGNAGTGFLANQLNNDAGRDLLLQAINGRADSLSQLATMLNTSVANVQNGVNAIQSQMASNHADSTLLASQNHAASQLLASQNHAADQLQNAQIEAADQLAVCQQTNTLSSQNERNTNSILNAIAGQNTLITKEFCDLKERELQNKINMQGDMITQLRNQISNDNQTLQFNAAFHALDDKIDAIASKQPNTVPVQWPNIVAANATPYVGPNYSSYGGWGNGFGGGIVF